MGRKAKYPGIDTSEIENITGSEASTGHGYDVTMLLNNYATNPVYHFFTVVRTDGNLKDRHMLFGLARVLEFSDEIDVVNISAGLDHISDPNIDCDQYGPKCKVCEMVEDVLKEDIIVVGGAGNKPHTKNVCCPSLERDVISVGGAYARCTAETDHGSTGHSLNLPPPNALWVRREDDRGSGEIFCSDRGCYPGASCAENRSVEEWPGTPKTETGKPDILAPLLLPREDEVGPFLDVGTSYATPIVAAGVANALVMLKDKDEDIWPLPSEVRGAIERASEEISGSDIGFFDCASFADSLFQNYGRRFVREESEEFGRFGDNS